MQEKSVKPVVIWLYLGVIMIAIQVFLGGITRLTGSGLSITEWKPIIGALYPSSDQEWQTAFAQYKSIAQFQYLNADYTVEDFKFIFFWEWLHRNWARAISVVFFLPFLYFLISGYLKREWVPQLIMLFVVGMLQGLVGWIMVASGLNDTNLYVNHFKLAAHFITALVAFVYTYWLALYIGKPTSIISSQKRKILIWVAALLVIQLFYGAFMAGLKAAQSAPTWPLIGSTFFPDSLLKNSWFSNPINVHFVHRNLAYIITILIMVWAWANRHIIQYKVWYWPVILVILQVVLGIASVLFSPKALRNNMGEFEWSAQLHQLVALALLASLVRALYYSRSPISGHSVGKEI